MSFKKKPGTEEDVFCLTFPLICEPWQRDRLDQYFSNAQNMENCLIAWVRAQVVQLERTRKWRRNQKHITKVCAEIGEVQKLILSGEAKLEKLNEKLKSIESSSEQKALRKNRSLLKKELKDADSRLQAVKKQVKACYDLRTEMIAEYGLTSDGLDQQMKKYRDHYSIHSAVTQKITARVWKSVKKYFYGNGKEIHFVKWTDFMSIAGKNNITGITYADRLISVAGLSLKVKLSAKDPYDYETQALARKIHFCGISRRWYPDGWHYFAQLYLGGTPPIKVHKATGELLHPIGSGRVGLDIGPQTLAAVGDQQVSLNVLASGIDDIHAEIRRIQRKMDRSRRATNQWAFDEKGSVIPINKVPPEHLKNKKRNWYKSKEYLRLESKLRYLHGKIARQRVELHNRLANQLLSYGDEFYIEKMDWKALAKRAKETKVSQKTGKYVSKKRFGKSIANRAPATFEHILENKVKHNNGSYTEINTWKAKASQYDHQTKACKKKHLGQRYHVLQDGRKVQRDLYSAFLIQNTNETRDGFIQELLERKFEHFYNMQTEELNKLSHIAVPLPNSMGIHAA